MNRGKRWKPCTESHRSCPSRDTLVAMGIRLAVVIGMAVVGACGSPSTGDDGDDGDDAPPPDAREFVDADPGVPFQTCRGRPYTLAPDQDWQHTIQTPITTAAGAPNHSSQDQIDPDGASVTLPGKFTYGLISKDLEDELIRVSIDDCTGWQELGSVATDTDGRIAMAVPAGMLPGPGVYEARFQVLGDHSTTYSFVWVLPRGTHIALTDIDGTMTQSDAELFQQMLDGSHVPVAYPGAVDLTLAHAERGHVVVFLTGRPYWLSNHTRDWLSDLAFAPGVFHGTDSNGEAVPSEGGVGAFKRAYLQSLLADGYVIDVAYGNAATDVYAYLMAPISADGVWIIGSHGGEQGTHAVVDTWVPRVAEVQALPAVTQPFQW